MAGDRKEEVLALAAGRDATQLDLSAAQGFLLSRIDGATPWHLLREIGGIPAEEVDACLARWLEEGVVEVVGGASGSSAAGPEADAASGAARAAADSSGPAATSAPGESCPRAPAEPMIDVSLLDEGLDLELEVQRRILAFEAGLARPYHELLGVDRDADPKQLKRAYFKLSKEFHPDRYFRKRIGDYGERLERIFKKVLEAHEILSDPDLCRVENHLDPASGEAPAASGAGSGMDAASVPGNAPTADAEPARPGQQAKPRPLTKLERLRQRMPFKINHAAIAERRARADEIFRAAQASQQAGRLQEAEASLRIAISFDPARQEFKEALGSLRIAAAGARASKLLDKPSERMSSSELLEALRLLEDVLPYRPHDPELNERAARVCLRLGKLEEALEYAETLLIRQPELAAAHTLVGQVHRQRGDRTEATRAFETALKFDEEDMEARRALAAVRIGARDAARGGMA